MSAELAYEPNDLSALKWALGCVLASYTERFKHMTTQRPYFSRWVLCVEMLCFLGIPALGFVTIGTPPYYAPLPVTLFILSTALLGPVGLALAFKSVVLNRPVLSAPETWTLRILAGWAVVGFFLYMVFGHGTMDLEWWRGYALVALLPAFAAIHLLYLATISRRTGAALA